MPLPRRRACAIRKIVTQVEMADQGLQSVQDPVLIGDTRTTSGLVTRQWSRSVEHPAQQQGRRRAGRRPVLGTSGAHKEYFSVSVM